MSEGHQVVYCLVLRDLPTLVLIPAQLSMHARSRHTGPALTTTTTFLHIPTCMHADTSAKETGLNLGVATMRAGERAVLYVQVKRLSNRLIKPPSTYI